MKKYSIGEVSNRLGLSRDTLRFYEKRGIIQPHKLKNGYRSYTYEDIRQLLNIMFYRRLNFSLEDIERILYKSTFHSRRSMIQEKIAEEKQQVEQHRQSLVHLNQLKALYDSVKRDLGHYKIKSFPPSYILPEDALNDLGVSDLCYLLNEYPLERRQGKETSQVFLLTMDTASVMKLKPELKHQSVLSYDQCVYTILASETPNPDPQTIQAAASWAYEMGYSLSGTAFSKYLPQCAFDDVVPQSEAIKEGDPVHYIELYLPLRSPVDSLKQK
ncbi:MerR family transcriptional regulator [Clostridium sp. E02]|uniref:MerR family transcriptional regulator n=1 Tax=Clostridium sp. E02 TaxID=2487134 RepID=UPI000F53E954|nr:MerR family transcriptional regulator [Clostridium sp. E02]